MAKNFYKNLLVIDQMIFNEAKADHIRHLILVTISTDKAVLLDKEVTKDEIKETLFHMKSNKASGSDGFSVDFFKATWPIIGKEVVRTI